MLKKLSVLLIALMLPMIFTLIAVSEAQAFKSCPNGGYRPPGTCSVQGTRYACNVKNCSKKYCPR